MPTWSAPEEGVCAGRRQRGRLVRTSHATTSPLLSLRRPGREGVSGRTQRRDFVAMGNGNGLVSPREDARLAVDRRERHALDIRAVPAEHHGIGRGVPHRLPRPEHCAGGALVEKGIVNP